MALELTLSPCILCIDGSIKARGEFYRTDSKDLEGRYPSKFYETAKSGDYIGLINNPSKGVVDFHISATHQQLRNPRWRNRVVHIERIVSRQVT